MRGIAICSCFHIVWKLQKNASFLNFGILQQFFFQLNLTCLVRLFDTHNVPFKYLNFWHFPPIFDLLKIDLTSGNTVWLPSSGFQKLSKLTNFFVFLMNFLYSKCKRSSLRSQCCEMRVETFFCDFQTLCCFFQF